MKSNGAVLNINLALISDDGKEYDFKDVCDIVESYHVSGFTALPSPGIGGEADVNQREPNSRINCYYNASSGLAFEDFLRRGANLIGILCERFNQREIGFMLHWVEEYRQRQVSGVAVRQQPVDLTDLVKKTGAPLLEVKKVSRTLVVAVHESSAGKANRMLFYKSPDWGGRPLVPSLKIDLEHPNADDVHFLLSAFWSKVPDHDPNLGTMQLELLDGGPKSECFKFSLDRTKRWEGLKYYSWRVAWLRLPDEVAEAIGEYRTVEPEPKLKKRSYGLSTLRAVKADHRNLAASWDVIHCLEDLFGGDLEIIPPNPNR